MRKGKLKRWLCLLTALVMISANTVSGAYAAELPASESPAAETAVCEIVEESLPAVTETEISEETAAVTEISELQESTEEPAAAAETEQTATEETEPETSAPEETEPEPVLNGLIKEDGAIRYYQDGTAYNRGLKFVTVDGTGSYYYFRKDGTAFTGGLLKFTHTNGKTYYFYFGKDGKAYTKGYKATATSSYATENCVVKTAADAGTTRKYYFRPNGQAFTGGLLKFVHTNGKTYYFYFGKDGQAYNKGYLSTATSSYAGTDGEIKKAADAGTRSYYYFKEDGHAFTGGLLKFVHTNDKTYYYYFGKDGRARTDGYLVTSSSSYAGKDCVVKTAADAGTSRAYYMMNNGHAFTGGLLKFTHKGKTYYFYFGTNGAAVKSALKQTKTYHVSSSDCSVVNKADGTVRTFYFKENAHGAVKEWLTVGGDTYYFGSDAAAVTGKQNIGNYLAYFDDNGVMTRRIDKTKKMVALTYDDGPSTYTSVILNTLEKYDAVATFFVVGSRVNSYKSTLTRTYNMGCEIGNHTYDHKILSYCSSSVISSQISRCSNAVKNILGVAPTIMRPPGGGMNSTVKATVGMPLIMWSIDTRDWEHRTASRTISCVKSQARDGDIILMHDLYSATATASKTIIPWLINQGFQLVTVSEMAECRGGMSKGTAYFTMR